METQMENAPRAKPLYWVGSSNKDLLALPEEVVDVFGYALYLAQIGKKHEQAKPLKGFGSAGVLGALRMWGFCPACVSEEGKARYRHAQGGPGFNPGEI